MRTSCSTCADGYYVNGVGCIECPTFVAIEDTNLKRSSFGIDTANTETCHSWIGGSKICNTIMIILIHQSSVDFQVYINSFQAKNCAAIT